MERKNGRKKINMEDNKEIRFDEEMRNMLEKNFQAALIIGGDFYTPEQIKLMMLTTNLQSLANTFLVADSNPEAIQPDFKRIALGLLGTSDWIKEGLNQGVF